VSAIDGDHGSFIVLTWRLRDRERTFEQAVTLQSATLCAEAEHRAAQTYRVDHVPCRFLDVLDAPGDAGRA
jgi:hypothetical protein